MKGPTPQRHARPARRRASGNDDTPAKRGHGTDSDHSKSGRGGLRRVLFGLGVLTIVSGAIAALLLWPSTLTFYTDASTINEPAATARIRDILWQPPVRLPAFISSSADDYEPRLSADGTTLFFVRGKAGENADIFCCVLTPKGWSDPRAVAAVNTEYDDLGPEPSADGRSLYFYSDRPGGVGGYDLWVARRRPGGRAVGDGPGGWAAAVVEDSRGPESGVLQPVNLGPSVNSEFDDCGPALTPDGASLYFASNRPPETDNPRDDPDVWPGTIREDRRRRPYDLYHAVITERGVGKARPITTLNTPYNEGTPVVSPFGDFVYFATDRPGGEGGFDLYRSRRLQGRHEPATNLGAVVNTAANELDPGQTLGGYGLYFSSDRPLERLDPEKSNPYQVYKTTSREVFSKTETRRVAVNWAAIWSQIGPNLLWALLATLLLLLLLAFFGDLKSRRMSLLARCVLASLAAHMLLMLLFNAWEVTAVLARELHRRGGIRIALLAPAQGSDLASQIRGEFTLVDAPTPAPAHSDLPQPVVEIESAAVMADLAVRHVPTDSADRVEVDWPTADARVAKAVGPAVSDVPLIEYELDPSLDLALPTDIVRTSGEEIGSVPAPALSQRAVVDRPPAGGGVGDPSPDASQSVLLVPQNVAGDSPHQHSLADSGPVRDAATQLQPVVSATMPEAFVAPQLTPDLTLPTVAQPRVNEQEPFEQPAHVIVPGVERSEPGGVAAFAAEADGPSMPEFEPADTTPDSGAEASFAEAGDTPASDARSVPTVLSASDVATVPGATLPLADLSLPMVEESTIAGQDESFPPTRRATFEPVRRPLDEFNHTGAVVSLQPLTESSPGPRTPPPDTDNLIDWKPVENDAAAHAPRLASFDQKKFARSLPQPPTLSLDLPTEIKPPDAPYAQRSRELRLDVAEDLGGGEETEESVRLALQWLAAHQSADGRWDSDGFDESCGECGGETRFEVDTALTGLSLLCFLAADHTQVGAGPYRDNVERGLQWLVGHQEPNGDLRNEETMYSQGIATIALAEAYGMTLDSRLREPVQRAVEFIVRARNRRVGGWRYDPGQPGDTSVLGWQIMALKSARVSGVDVPMEPFLAARRWLDKVSSPSEPGRYSYQPTTATTAAMTAEGLFVQQILGVPPNEPRMRQSVEYVLEHLPDWNDDLNTYYWYYATLALFHQQGEPWKRWNEALVEQLLAHQRADGAAAGSWDPQGKWTTIGGRVYQTALCTLMLEVYYRYVPLFFPSGPPDAIGTIRGLVTDASTGAPLAGAAVRLDLPDRPSLQVITAANGSYALSPPETPAFFALSASNDGYLPTSKNVAAAMVQGAILTLDFELQPETHRIVAIEAVPEVHHLGDDRFSGRINSRFQKRSEGTTFEATFTLKPGQVPPDRNVAELTMLARGVQTAHRIRINGELIDRRLDHSPSDGSFGEFTAPIDSAMLQTGPNTIEIIAGAVGDDTDDFEFVNLQVRLLP